MPAFYCTRKVTEPEDIIPFLAKGQLHWRRGYSAFELATSWVRADGFPPTVRAVLDTASEYRGAEFVEGMFERETDLGTRGRPSQTDLLALVRLPVGHAVIGVEGKVEESFGPIVGEWRDDSPGKERRLKKLCETLGLEPTGVSDLRYQLLHRCAAAIYETKRLGWRHAMMLVHSFSAAQTSFEDFLTFASAVGAKLSGPNEVSSPIPCEGIDLRLAWVADLPAAVRAETLPSNT